MTTPTRTTSSNKTALRASLKKEDESLAERLVATDVALVVPPEPEAAVAPVSQAAAAPLSKPADEGKPAAVVEAPGKAAKNTAPAKTKSAKGAAAAAKAKPGSKKAAAAAKPQAKVEAAAEAGKKTAGLEEALEKIEKTAKEKGDKLVRYTVELLKSEEAAIEAVRAELSKAAGWAASKSDILRAAVRLFAEQKMEQMKALLAAVSVPEKGKKKD
ncbi:MAG: hypothetical protein ABTS16_08990 [Candidatus Accumulibacter phosphatis]|jgi:hypothetical protein|uniref:Uncharacterized protein n=2 Tax=Candidatus Accumulibacter TaxID=327159 RepID=A0A080M4V2_9PROT|nr:MULTISPECIES: hypothetical protein [Candidatus Accumulibacter]KFB72059.1 MAG: hypothetical protein AW09_002758 [Candidatus Accumulibacter phosphatis]MBL8409286.1 hypothetical protein [Accumulibacter sp.]NMQ06915.1 hypothetical protein [Candidatus Accumulibacter contiguus]HRF11106.1 hypothetical protein [Candidatus Accumulibacter phosphatis]